MSQNNIPPSAHLEEEKLLKELFDCHKRDAALEVDAIMLEAQNRLLSVLKTFGHL